MYLIYSFFLFFVLILYVPVYFVKARLLRGKRIHIKERLGRGLVEDKSPQKSIWIHAVSVGEVLSLQNLISQIREQHPDWIIHFSSLTNAGIQMAKENLHGLNNIFFIPLDFKRIVRKFFKTLNPTVFVLAESEFWPNLLREAARQTKGVLLINGRISSGSFRRYKRLRFAMKTVLKNIDRFLVQTEKDKEKLVKIGVESERIEVPGNLKSEVNLSALKENELSQLRESLNIPTTKKVVLAGSTRKGEEELLLEAYRDAKSKNKDILFIIAPRHIERVNEIEKICKSSDMRSLRRTLAAPSLQWDVLLLDTLGELARFYALADIAFVGGSLVPWGGHNLLEPAFYKKPIFFGPHMENFSYLAEKFVDSGAAQIACNKDDLIEMFLFQKEIKLREMGAKSWETLKSLQGATEKTLRCVEEYMVKS